MLGLLLGSDYGNVTQMTLGIGSSKYSQSVEFSADSYGLEMLECTYGTVAGATTLFEEMDTGNEWRYFMSTHPGFKKWLKRIKGEILKKHSNTTRKPIPLKKI